MSNSCKQCKKEFKPVRDSKGIFCSHGCYWQSMKGKVVFIGGHKGKKHSNEYKEHMSKVMTGRKNPKLQHVNHFAWRGDSVGYRSLHKWVERMLGKPSKCTDCGKVGYGRQIHWANISQEYKRDITDWTRLCVKCHKRFDLSKKLLFVNK